MVRLWLITSSYSCSKNARFRAFRALILSTNHSFPKHALHHLNPHMPLIVAINEYLFSTPAGSLFFHTPRDSIERKAKAYSARP